MVLLIGAVLLPLLLLAGGLGARFAVTEQARFQTNVTATAGLVMAVIDREIFGLSETLRALSASPTLAADDLEGFHRQAALTSQLLNLAIVLRDTNGHQLVNTLVPWGQPLPDRSMLQPFDAIVLRRLQPLVSGHFIGLADGEHRFAVVVPVLRDGQPVYLLHLSLLATRLRDVLLGIGLPPGWFATIIDQEGLVLARSRDHDTMVGRRAAILPILPDPGGVVTGEAPDREGHRYFFAAQASHSAPFTILAAAPTEVMAASLRRVMLVVAALATGLIALSLVAARRFGNQLTQAVLQIAELAARVGSGQLIQPPITAIREVNDVGHILAEAAEAREAESQHQRMILNELDHRVKNTLAIIQAMTRLSARDATDVQSYSAQMIDRLDGLSRTQTLLRGAGGMAADLQEVLRAELMMHDSGGQGRLLLEGPALPLPAATVTALGMLFHELATNAAKYGALSVPGGALRVHWTVQPNEAGEPWLNLLWEESGGPPVVPPTRRGFGSQLIERGLARQLRATVTLQYPPEGLLATIVMPVPAAMGGDRGGQNIVETG